jgi:hypothetical protein
MVGEQVLTELKSDDINTRLFWRQHENILQKCATWISGLHKNFAAVKQAADSDCMGLPSVTRRSR